MLCEEKRKEKMYNKCVNDGSMERDLEFKTTINLYITNYYYPIVLLSF